MEIAVLALKAGLVVKATAEGEDRVAQSAGAEGVSMAHLTAFAAEVQRERLDVLSSGAGAVVSEVLAERKRQDARWGGHSHNDRPSTPEFVEMIQHSAARARDAAAHDPAEARQRLLKVAAMAVAAVQCMDRTTLKADALDSGVRDGSNRTTSGTIGQP